MYFFCMNDFKFLLNYTYKEIYVQPLSLVRKEFTTICVEIPQWWHFFIPDKVSLILSCKQILFPVRCLS